jgi:flagellin
MRVQHNIVAMNSYRNYNNNTKTINKNIEKLSSGYKINRAGDDAAGLAISEKMRAQITGLEVAQKNAKDGISLVQTAEGALTEVHSMLNRMFELAEQSANGTYDNGTDRSQLQKELSQLRTEVNRIADSSNFNGIKLLDGSLGKNSTALVDTDTLKTNGVTSISVYGGGTDDAKTKCDAITFAVSKDGDNTKVSMTVATAVKGVKWVAVNSINASDNGSQYSDAAAKDTDPSATFAGISGGSVTFRAVIDENATGTDKSDIYAQDLEHYRGIEIVVNVDAADKDGNFDSTAGKVSNVGDKATFEGLTLQIGDTGDTYNQLDVTLLSMKAVDMGIGSVSIGSQDDAAKAMLKIKSAINYVSDVRGTLGATQNRLEHTINNLSVMQENIQDAESTIRDTDVASEMMKYTKNSILVQSAQAMLAQANQQPQGVLQLLQ